MRLEKLPNARSCFAIRKIEPLREIRQFLVRRIGMGQARLSAADRRIAPRGASGNAARGSSRRRASINCMRTNATKTFVSNRLNRDHMKGRGGLFLRLHPSADTP